MSAHDIGAIAWDVGFALAALIFITGWMILAVQRAKFKHEIDKLKATQPSTKEHDIDHNAGS